MKDGNIFDGIILRNFRYFLGSDVEFEDIEKYLENHIDSIDHVAIVVKIPTPRQHLTEMVSLSNYNIDFIDIGLDDFLKELNSERSEIDFFDIFSSFPDANSPSRFHEGPGCRACQLNASFDFKEELSKALKTSNEKVVAIPFDTMVYVVFKDGSCVGFSLSTRDKFEPNVLQIVINRKYMRGSNNTSPRRKIDVSGVKGKEELLSFVTKLLRSMRNTSRENESP